jgi:hypothetical protein
MGENFDNQPAGVCGVDPQAAGVAPPAAPGRVRHTGYLHPLDAYPARFQALLSLAAPPVRLRAMKRWIAIGRDAAPPAQPPLDDPGRLKDWWTRHMANRVPDWICSLATVAPAVPAAPTASPPSEPSPGPLFDAAPPALGPSAPAPVGYASALQRVRAAEAAAGELYTALVRRAAAPDTPDDQRARLTAEAEQARRSWDDLGDRLRAMERDAEKILSASGRMWMADDVIASTTLVHLVLRESIRGLWRRARPKLTGKSIADGEALWDAEVEAMFGELRANKFTAPAVGAPADVAAA